MLLWKQKFDISTGIFLSGQKKFKIVKKEVGTPKSPQNKNKNPDEDRSSLYKPFWKKKTSIHMETADIKKSIIMEKKHNYLLE